MVPAWATASPCWWRIQGGHPHWPGVGKPPVIDSILLILRAKKVRCLICAPRGCAAKRVSETTGVESKTIHRLLEVSPASGGFTRNEAKPLECDMLVVDKTSMVDVVLINHLLRTLPPNANLLLVGDEDQFPPWNWASESSTWAG